MNFEPGDYERIFALIENVLVRLITDAMVYSMMFFILVLLVWGLVEIAKEDKRNRPGWNGRYENV